METEIVIENFLGYKLREIRLSITIWENCIINHSFFLKKKIRFVYRDFTKYNYNYIVYK